MGNQSSCFFSGSCGSAPSISFIAPDGNLGCISSQVATAADLMIEFPGHVVAIAESSAAGAKISPIKADEVMRSGLVYLLVPVDQFGFKVSDRQMEVAKAAVESRRRRRKGMGSGSDKRLFPAGACKGEVNTGSAGNRVRPVHQWRPVLDTIHEAHSQ
ncbi:hypothetical protein IHE45_12G008400 [Dioscorea alata]|uniref:Uncharacterized protein n=1 Tax=Dioscorea alata TaxID=55571 RepID=A0ACB7V044_DIOAL|nr:hypothetical protein IHE45_12G008400 [Dioscorea alata]